MSMTCFHVSALHNLRLAVPGPPVMLLSKSETRLAANVHQHDNQLTFTVSITAERMTLRIGYGM